MLPDTCPECGSEFISHVPCADPDMGSCVVHGCGVCGHTWTTEVSS